MTRKQEEERFSTPTRFNGGDLVRSSLIRRAESE
jgi:hypothetical protein